MNLIGKLSGLLLAAVIMVLSMVATTGSAQAQPYTVCNNSAGPVAVCVQVNCGGGVAFLAPCPAMIPPGACFSWPVPAGCFVVGVRVNGGFYPVPAAFPLCYAVAAPPPAAVCFTGAIPHVQIW